MVDTFTKKLKIAGGLLGFFGIIFVIFRLSEYTTQIGFADFGLKKWAWIAYLILIYCLANTLLALAWLHLMTFLGEFIDLSWAVQIYGRSQLARYIPGNVFHLAGRQALGMANGLPGWALAKSAVWEIGMIIVAGIPFSVLALPLYWTGLSIWLALFLFFVLFGGMALFLRRWSPFLAYAFVFQGLFLVVSGCVFAGILSVITPDTMTLSWLPTFCGAYVAAWLVGFVTPGAPAGAGIRELVLLFLLSDHVAEATLLLAVVIGRMVTIFGDLLFFVIVTFIAAGAKTRLNRD